jgi:hypothetical protein
MYKAKPHLYLYVARVISRGMKNAGKKAGVVT